MGRSETLALDYYWTVEPAPNSKDALFCYWVHGAVGALIDYSPNNTSAYIVPFEDFEEPICRYDNLEETMQAVETILRRDS